MKQGNEDLPGISEDNKIFKLTFERFAAKPNLIHLKNGTSKKKLNRERGKLKKYIRVNPKERILLVYSLVGHGMQESGK
jgi:hypothetical protein